MISGNDIYDVLAGIVPLYVAMFLAYGSVCWWKIFTPDQCSGINRFVAVFAVPLLSFHFISSNNPYTMDFRFIAADSLQKVVILVVLLSWQILTKNKSLEWMITLFSLSTLPNTLVMGIPLLKAMYGDFSANLMVQIVVLQAVVWYTLLLVMLEYRGAKLLISEQFPETAGSITSVRVDPDVVSLNGREPLQADAEVGDDGKLHVVVRRSSATSSEFLSYNRNMSHGLMPRVSNMSGVEIYSVQSTPRASSFDHTDFYPMFSSKERGSRNGDTDSYMGDVFLVHSLKERNSDFSEEMRFGRKSMGMSTSGGLGGAKVQIPNSSCPQQTFIFPGGSTSANKAIFQKENGSSARKSNDQNEIAMENNSRLSTNETPILIHDHNKVYDIEEEQLGNEDNKRTQMPPASVMTKLIIIMVWRKLIRNPNTYASLLGLVWSLISFRFHVKMPTIVRGSIAILSDAGLGMAMFSLGLFMALQTKMIGCGKRVATFAMAVRFLIGPAVIAATSLAVGLRGDLLHVSIVQAALPQGIVPFVFAKEYNVHADILSTAVIFGMVIALPITIIYYILLGL